jgi:amino acid transporter
MAHSTLHIAPNWFSAGFATIVTVYFWWLNIRGMQESSGKALRIMQITTVMVVIFLVWAPLTLIIREPAQIPPAPLPSNLHFADDALGWFKGTFWPSIPAIAIIALGHSLLSMSGFETLAQVYREIACPKLRNLKVTGNIVCIYATVCTGVVGFEAASPGRAWCRVTTAGTRSGRRGQSRPGAQRRRDGAAASLVE